MGGAFRRHFGLQPRRGGTTLASSPVSVVVAKTFGGGNDWISLMGTQTGKSKSL